MLEPHAVNAPGPPLTIVEPARRPSAKAPLVWGLETAVWWLPLALIVWLALFNGSAAVTEPVRDWRWVAIAALAAVGVAGMLVMPLWRYRVHRWEVGPNAIYTRSGWLTQERRIVPIARIQTVDTERGPIEQLLGLTTVTITTASSAGEVRISALDRPVADAVAAQLADIFDKLPDDAT